MAVIGVWGHISSGIWRRVTG